MERAKKYKYPYIMIRCKESTKERWGGLLLEFKKKRFTAEDVLLLMIRCLEENYIKGRLI